MRGGLQAWDPVKHKLVWRVDGGGGIGGGTVTTGGNLVFQTINDGRFAAVSADKGEKLYEIQTGKYRCGAADHLRGRWQTVRGLHGRHGAAPRGPSVPMMPRSITLPMLFVFALDGKAELPAPVPPPAPAGTTAPQVR